MSVRLTQNFNLSEFQHPGHPVPPELLPNVQRLADNLQRLRDRVGMPIHIHSGYRTPAINTGAKKSQHLLGKAADIRIPGMTPAEVHRMILSMIKAGEMDQGGVGLYDKRGKNFVHYDTRGRAARWRQK